MDLQHLASEIISQPNAYDHLREIYDKAVVVSDINTEEDIDVLNQLLLTTMSADVLYPLRINVDRVITHANVLKPYLDYSKLEDFFI
jgi:hypothetical protein